MNVLVTGGAGYIGSHAALRLLEHGHAVTIVDDLSRGHAEVIDVLRPLGDLHFVAVNAGDEPAVTETLRDRAIDVVMHFAALAYVGESVEQPLAYYRANTASSVGLLRAMDAAGVDRLVFSSTCATYGEPDADHVPIAEACPQAPVNPYGRSKLMVEWIVRDLVAARASDDRPFSCTLLRYFNVAGCDGQGRLGEDHRPETHLVPICLEAALGQRPRVTIFGTDYRTPDGTCVRDYVHVDDLIDAHLVAMEAFVPGEVRAYNVGIGRGYSVREVIDACRAVTGVPFEAAEGSRRPGDPPALYNDASLVQAELGWQPRHTGLESIIETAWRWKEDHPAGYGPRTIGG